MKVLFDKSFYRRLVKIKDKATLEKVREAILHAETATEVSKYPKSKRWRGSKPFTVSGLVITA